VLSNIAQKSKSSEKDILLLTACLRLFLRTHTTVTATD